MCHRSRPNLRWWASLGAGTGTLEARGAASPNTPWREWGRGDLTVWTWEAGVSVPLADTALGAVRAEGAGEGFRLDIDDTGRGAHRIKGAAHEGRRWRAGLSFEGASGWGAHRLGAGWIDEGGASAAPEAWEVHGALAFALDRAPRLGFGVEAALERSPGTDHERWSAAIDARWRAAAGRTGIPWQTRIDAGGAGAGALEGELGYGVRAGGALGVVRPFVNLREDATERRLGAGAALWEGPARAVRIERWRTFGPAGTGTGAGLGVEARISL